MRRGCAAVRDGPGDLTQDGWPGQPADPAAVIAAANARAITAAPSALGWNPSGET